MTQLPSMTNLMVKCTLQDNMTEMASVPSCYVITHTLEPGQAVLSATLFGKWAVCSESRCLQRAEAGRTASDLHNWMQSLALRGGETDSVASAVSGVWPSESGRRAQWLRTRPPACALTEVSEHVCLAPCCMGRV